MPLYMRTCAYVFYIFFIFIYTCYHLLSLVTEPHIYVAFRDNKFDNNYHLLSLLTDNKSA